MYLRPPSTFGVCCLRVFIFKAYADVDDDDGGDDDDDDDDGDDDGAPDLGAGCARRDMDER